MSWQLSAHWLDKSAPMGISEKPIAELEVGSGGGTFDELLGLPPFDPDADSIDGLGAKVSRQKIEAAMRHCCQKHVDGESQLYELQFFLSILLGWKRGEKSVFIVRC
ncbi:MAG: hypothetical protein JNM43_09430 [Planctomycetaceae bacterium]|nr:hypothetical protein [Planctomycetaceae bacterium]